MTDDVDDDDDDGLTLGELVPKEGGTWSGLLFDNPRIGLAPRLTWTFRYPFQEVDRDYASSNVFLDVDWLPLAVPSWRDMAGQAVRSAPEPAEASVYFFEHHQYDGIDLEIVAQQGLAIHCRATLSGDLDGLGLDTVSAEAWLRFKGITVQLSDAASADAALSRLQEFTDTSGLVCLSRRHSESFRFGPTDLA